MSEKDFLTVHDIAQELGLTARTVRRLFSIGKLQGKKSCREIHHYPRSTQRVYQ